MHWYIALFLGFLQGLTEFLPISSSGHLYLAEEAMGLHVADNPFFDVMLHAGTLLALGIYFRKDWLQIVKELWHNKLCYKCYQGSFSGLLILGTIPIVVFGYLMKEIYPFFRNPIGVSSLLIVVGIVFLVVSRLPQRATRVTPKSALVMGLFQVIAILPGVSRSGLTMSGGMFMGLTKEVAARFSFLLALPAISAATIVSILDVNMEYVVEIGITNVIIGFVAACISSLLFISFFLRFIRKYSLNIFGIYLIIIGLVILTILLW